MAKLKGWIKLYRQITSNFLWTEKPYDKAHAWIDLIFLANTQSKKKLNRYGKVITIKRGECFVSKSFLAERWGWSKNKVVRYLGMLSEQQMCTVHGYSDGTSIFLINFEKFQGRQYADEPSHEPSHEPPYGPSHEPADEPTDGPQDKEYIKNIEDIIEEPQEARARKGDIKDGKIFVDEVNGWVPLEVPEEIREHYDSYLILGLIDEHGNYIYNKDEDED